MARISDQAATAAEAIRVNLETAVERARADTGLSLPGQQRKIAAAYLDAKAKMDTLSANVQGGIALTNIELQRQLFGAANVTGADAISIRDADDRAAQITTADEAQRLLHTADVNGDEQMARAVAGRAFQEAQSPFGAVPWQQVVDDYTATRPGVAQRMQELLEAQRNRVSDAWANTVALALPTPTEVTGFSEGQLETLAQQSSTVGQ